MLGFRKPVFAGPGSGVFVAVGGGSVLVAVTGSGVFVGVGDGGTVVGVGVGPPPPLQPGNWNEPIRVRHDDRLVVCRYSLVYQKVHPSGSTDKLL